MSHKIATGPVVLLAFVMPQYTRETSTALSHWSSMLETTFLRESIKRQKVLGHHYD